MHSKAKVRTGLERVLGGRVWKRSDLLELNVAGWIPCLPEADPGLEKLALVSSIPRKAGDDSGFRADRIVELGGERAEEAEVAAREILPLFYDEDAVGDGARRGRDDDQQQPDNAQARGARSVMPMCVSS